MFSPKLRIPLLLCAFALTQGFAASLAGAVTILRDPFQGAGFVNVDGGLPLILGAPVGTPLEIDIEFTDLQYIELMAGATTTLEFAVGNTGNTADVDYRFIFDLSDNAGNLITSGALDEPGTVTAGVIKTESLDLTPLPAVDVYGLHILVETNFTSPNSGSGRFDLYVAGGAGDPGTFVSGPIRFNRAVVGKGVPEPASCVIGLAGMIGCSLLRRNRRRA